MILLLRGRCYVSPNCTSQTNGGSFLHRYLECSQKPEGGGGFFGRQLESEEEENAEKEEEWQVTAGCCGLLRAQGGGR